MLFLKDDVVIVGVVWFLFVLIVVFIMDFVGCKVLFFVLVVIMFVVNLILGLYIYFGFRFLSFNSIVGLESEFWGNLV